MGPNEPVGGDGRAEAECLWSGEQDDVEGMGVHHDKVDVTIQLFGGEQRLG